MGEGQEGGRGKTVKGGGGGVKGCGVKAPKAASQATSSDRALLPSQAGRVLGHAHALHTLCKESSRVIKSHQESRTAPARGCCPCRRAPPRPRSDRTRPPRTRRTHPQARREAAPRPQCSAGARPARSGAPAQPPGGRAPQRRSRADPAPIPRRSRAAPPRPR